MKPLVIGCSPRQCGNSDAIVSSIITDFDVDSVLLRNLSYVPCDDCEACKRIGKCVHEDDASMLYEMIEKRDVIVLVAPVYFFSFDAHTKAFIDRAQYMWSRERKKDTSKRVYLIGVGGQTREDIFGPMELTTYSFALTIGAKYMGGLFFRGVDAKGDIYKGDNLAKVHDFMEKIIG